MRLFLPICVSTFLALSGGLSAATFAVRTEFPEVDGSVFVIQSDAARGVVYLGGSFTAVGGQTRHNVAAVNAATGALLSFSPDMDNAVTSIVIDGSTIFLTGAFNHVNSQVRSKIASFDISTGSLTAFAPPAFDDTINSAVVHGSAVYVAGPFTMVSATTRRGFAALETATGDLTSWDPGANGGGSTLTTDGTTLYVTGSFSSFGGQSRSLYAAIPFDSNNATAWNPGGMQSYSIVYANSMIYAGGSFGSIGGQSRNNAGALSPSGTGLAVPWDPNVTGTLNNLAPTESTVYLGGDFTAVGGTARTRLAAVDATSGALTSWDPTANDRVYAINVLGNTVYIGGLFTAAGGVARSHFAAITRSPLAPVLVYNGRLRLRTGRSAIRLRGTATGTVTSVLYRVGTRGAFRTATGTESWSFRARLRAARNRVAIFARGPGGDSATTTVVIRH